MTNETPPLGSVTFACRGCGKTRSYPFLDTGESVEDRADLRALAPTCECGRGMKIESARRDGLVIYQLMEEGVK